MVNKFKPEDYAQLVNTIGEIIAEVREKRSSYRFVKENLLKLFITFKNREGFQMVFNLISIARMNFIEMDKKEKSKIMDLKERKDNSDEVSNLRARLLECLNGALTELQRINS